MERTHEQGRLDGGAPGRRDGTKDLAPLGLAEHLEIVRDWQRRTGNFGKCPPKAEYPKTSNFIQWARKRVRDFGDRKYAAALASVGIATEKAGLHKGLSDSAQAILVFVRQKRQAPDLGAAEKEERQLAAWLLRMQAGVLPGNHVEWAGGKVSDLVDQVIAETRMVQHEAGLGQQWLEFCARSHDLMPRLHKGDTWGSRLPEAGPQRMSDAFPWLSAAKSACRLGGGKLPLCAPDPQAVILEINKELGLLPKPVEFSPDRSSTAAFQIRLANAGLLSMGLTVSKWVSDKGLRRA